MFHDRFHVIRRHRRFRAHTFAATYRFADFGVSLNLHRLLAAAPIRQVLFSHLVIAQIQIGAASSSNDFVKIFNPTGTSVDLTGWKLHKKSNTGTDYSLRTLTAGNTIAAGGYFTWANSEGGFAQSIGADT